MQFTPELELVVAAMRARFVLENDLSASVATAAVVSAAMHIAVRNKVLLLLREQLLPVMNPEQSGHLQQYKLRTIQLNSAIIRESVALCSALSKNNVDFIFMKGPLQQKNIFDDFFFRPTSDIDILAPASRYNRIYEILAETGYKSDSSSVWWRVFLGEQHLTKSGPPPVTVDLHYRIQQPGSPAPRSTEDFLSKPDWTSAMGVSLPHLANRAVPVLSAISIVKGLFNRESVGAHVADLYACIRPDVPHQLNNFLTVASGQNLRGTALLALRIVSETFGVKLEPAGEIAAMLPAVLGHDLVRMALTPTDPDLVWPKRRDVLWHLCLKRPGQYALEAGRAMASEAALRLFERPAEPEKQ